MKKIKIKLKITHRDTQFANNIPQTRALLYDGILNDSVHECAHAHMSAQTIQAPA